MITGTVTLRLPTQDTLVQDMDGAVLSLLDECPDGVHVVIDVHERTYFTPSVAQLLHRNGGRLHIEITGSSPEVIGKLIRAGRAGRVLHGDAW